jgi:hypothetical protein
VEAQLPEETRSAKVAEEQSEEWRGEAGSLGRRAVADVVKGGENLHSGLATTSDISKHEHVCCRLSTSRKID